MTCRPPAAPLDPLFDRWPAGRVIHVIYDTAFAPESFNPGVDGAGRPRKPTWFAPIFTQCGHGKLVDLTSEGLHRLKVPKHELITSPARNYPLTARWAEALHRQCADADGLLWMSRRRDRDHALLLFGDRLAGALSGSCVGGPLARNPTLRDAVLAAALRAGIEAD